MAGIFGGPANPLAAQPTLTDVPDVDLVSPPPESISTIAFSPVADHLAVGSWGPDVRTLALGALDLPSVGRPGECWFLIPFFGWCGGLYRSGYTTLVLKVNHRERRLHPILGPCWTCVGPR